MSMEANTGDAVYAIEYYVSSERNVLEMVIGGFFLTLEDAERRLDKTQNYAYRIVPLTLVINDKEKLCEECKKNK